MFSICLLPTAGLRSRSKIDAASIPELFFMNMAPAPDLMVFVSMAPFRSSGDSRIKKVGKPLRGQGNK